MPQEFSESEPIVLGEARLGALCSRSARWIRQKENEGIVSRLEPNGTSPSRALYLLDEAMPRLIAHLTSKRQPTPETQALAAQRVEAGRLKLEAARLELGKLEGKLIETEAARRVFGDLVVCFRQRLMYLPGALKTKLGLELGQTLALQKGMRDALTDLAKGGKSALGGEAATGKPAPQRRRRSKHRDLDPRPRG
jgi:hypothetical protein